MRYILILLLSGIFLLSKAQDVNIFREPDNCYGPYVWWHWLGSNFSKDGITKDLEAMKKSGIGGATIFNITSAVQETHAPIENNPWPEKTYRSDAYWDAIKHAAKEANRLGLEVGLHNTVGYSTTGGPWISEDEGMQCVVMTQKEVKGGKKISLILERGIPPIYKGWGSFKKKTKSYHDIAVIAVPHIHKTLSADDVINVTSYMDGDRLIWSAPVGSWTVYRIGYAPTMANPHPVPDELIGNVLEVDKISKKQNIHHWKEVLQPLKKHVGKYLGKSFKHILIDSYEAGEQNWTAGFENVFKRLKGYDPIPWLTSRLGTEEERKRFRYDYDEVLSFMYYNDGFKPGKDMIHEYGLELQFEPYGGPFNTYLCTPLADIPMGEFWTNSQGEIDQQVVSSARATGKRIIAAEAFTSRPENSAWTEDPAFLKYSADGAFCSGVNRLVLHHWVHQPFDDKYQPGLSMGWWGTHFSRHQTWFEMGQSFFTYLARIQYMMQQGEEVIEYLCLDEVVGRADAISSYDFLNMRLRVEDGNVVLPSGRKYAFLVCPKLQIVDCKLLKKLLSLSRKGVAIVGNKPERTPGLTNYPECDKEVCSLGSDLKLYASIDEARKHLGILPFMMQSASSDSVKSVLRKTDKGYIVFLANRTDKAQILSVSVKVEGLLPELWNPETGTTETAESWRYEYRKNIKYTNIKLLLNPNETKFIVLNRKATQYQLAQGDKKLILPEPTEKLRIKGKWLVEFYPKLGNQFVDTFYQLSDFKYSTDSRIMYFSGKVVYKKEFHISREMLGHKRLVLSLGDVYDIARVRLNRYDCGVWWYSPYRKDVTDYLVEGDNQIIIEVVVNWANRLIGDEQEPVDFEWGTDRGPFMGRAMKAYPTWFIDKKGRPSNRKAFVIWYYHSRESELQSAGLVGPVLIEGFK